MNGSQPAQSQGLLCPQEETLPKFSGGSLACVRALRRWAIQWSLMITRDRGIHEKSSARFSLFVALLMVGTVDGLSLIKYPSITSQACSAALSVLNGEPTTLTAGRFW